MIQLAFRGHGRSRWSAAAVVVVAGALTAACGGDGDGDPDGSGAAGGAGGNGLGGAGAAGTGGGGNPDIEEMKRVVDCEGGLQLQKSAGDEWEDEGECQRAFITTWDTTQPGASDEDQVQLPIVETGSYGFWVSWGDGSYDYIDEWDDPDATHTYEEPGEYEVRIIGEIVGINFRDLENEYSKETNTRDSLKLLTLDQYGPLVLGDYAGIFGSARNMTSDAEDAPDLSQTTFLHSTFASCEKFNGPIGNWDTSTVTSFRTVFEGATVFNAAIGKWDVSAATEIVGVLQNASPSTSPRKALIS